MFVCVPTLSIWNEPPPHSVCDDISFEPVRPLFEAICLESVDAFCIKVECQSNIILHHTCSWQNHCIPLHWSYYVGAHSHRTELFVLAKRSPLHSSMLFYEDYLIQLGGSSNVTLCSSCYLSNMSAACQISVVWYLMCLTFAFGQLKATMRKKIRSIPRIKRRISAMHSNGMSKYF